MDSTAYDSESQMIASRKSKRLCRKSPKLAAYDDDSTGELIIIDDASASSSSSKSKATSSKSNSTNINKKRKKRDSSASSDEERWLTAIESGKLEDVDDELKKIKPKDPSLMTARQRAMYDRNSDGCTAATRSNLMSLPTGYKEKILTAEDIQKAALKSQKRKQLANEKREKDKKKTMERLLKKQETKPNKITKPKPTRSSLPSIVYQQSINQTTLTFPEGVTFPLKPQTIPEVPQLKYCSTGCGNLKKYSCSHTGAGLCSLACYRLNISRAIL